jgi:hypothetical protein
LTYGVFIREHDLITDNDKVHVADFDPTTYMDLQKMGRRQHSSDF